MHLFSLVLILISVSLSAIAQLSLKMGMSSQAVTATLAGGSKWQAALAIAGSPLVVGGLALYGFGAVLWLFVLAKLDLSVAYPFVGLGFILTMLLSLWVLGEDVSWLRVAGTLMIAGGCVLVARSA